MSALLLLDCLPDRQHWARHLSAPDPQEGWTVLARAVVVCLDHQSQESTDIRWLKLMHMAIMGKLRFPAEMEERVEELRLYPDKGDMRSVRPFIRAGEMALRQLEDGKEKPAHVPPSPHGAFWLECRAKTGCIADREFRPPRYDVVGLTNELIELSKAVSDHFDEASKDTGIDPRLDGSFGLVLYALALLLDAARAHHHLLATGRIILRSIVEIFITLRYLTVKDDSTIWAQYRNYGSGQAKLSFLKNLREEDVPDFINLKELENLANEDMWLEFQNISLGSWANSDLRKMATEAGCKDVYDKFYGWSSSFAHGHWVSVRDTVFATCMNPLHRLHRIPAPPRIMPSMLSDACSLVNRMLDDLNKLYPTFKLRMRWHKTVKSKGDEKVKSTSSEQSQ
jgi:Family of unknown function (DUF5677)